MKNILKYIISAIILTVIVSACNDKQSSDNPHAEWKQENELYFSELNKSGKYDSLTVPANQGGGILLIKELKAGPVDSIPPKSSSIVEFHYKGWGKHGNVFDKSFVGEQPTASDKPLVSPVNGLIKGFSEMLLSMTSGDKYEVVIPWHLAYGERGNSSIPPFSTLHFEIELIRTLRY